MTTIILSIFATLLAALASLTVLWFVQDAPEAVTNSTQRVATSEADSVARLCEFADCAEYPEIVASGNR